MKTCSNFSLSTVTS
ncbi:hypothetical protein QTG54_005364 [Skeletonema marinoi]|uniref:Uncharacterized protein n=1 Tax=Skeletonema marinoi TaxID=267567 RepID=A0AAD8YE43_9STRA|nr:hypothetical protein QTG54_005364 [Skeletonema marinoi]